MKKKLNNSMNIFEHEDNVKERNFKPFGWDQDIARMKSCLTFWKRNRIYGKKIKTFWLLDATLPFGKIMDEGRNSLYSIWLVNEAKSKSWRYELKKVMKGSNDEWFELKIKMDFIMNSSFRTLYHKSLWKNF
jgi:hypothetical protein